MLPQQMSAYKRNLLKAIQDKKESLYYDMVVDMVDYHSRCGEIKGYLGALELFDKYLKHGDELSSI